MIEDYFTTDFKVYVLTETKEYGKSKKTWADDGDYKGAFFTPATDRTVRYDKQDYVISKNLYCGVIDIELGDRVKEDGKMYDVIFKTDTANKGHHLFIGLTSV